MNKYLFYSTIALMALASCSSDDFIGDHFPPPNAIKSSEINFGGETGKITRADDKSGKTAADSLNNTFHVYGTKTITGDNSSPQVVFKDYTVTYASNSWSYDNASTNQSIKYWDYSATQYDFAAYSTGSASNVTATNFSTSGYTLSGTVGELNKCYYADGVNVKKPESGNYDKVTFKFRSTATKIAIGIYEIIPGYSIKEIKFYSGNDEATSDTKPALFASSACIPTNEASGTIAVAIDNSQNAKATFTASTTDDTKKSASISFTTFTLATDKEGKEAQDSETKFLGRESASKTTSDEITVFPTNISDGLTLKVDYTLISTDGSGETITVTGATAKVPETYTDWQPNTKYTYVFKITKDTNGSTGGESTGLHPIEFDAAVVEVATGETGNDIEIKNAGTPANVSATHGRNGEIISSEE